MRTIVDLLVVFVDPVPLEGLSRGNEVVWESEMRELVGKGESKISQLVIGFPTRCACSPGDKDLFDDHDVVEVVDQTALAVAWT